jgi:transposase
VRTDFTAGEVRRFAKWAKDAAQARRLLAIAVVLDGALREDAAKIGGMDRQTLRDWVIRFPGSAKPSPTSSHPESVTRILSRRRWTALTST